MMIVYANHLLLLDQSCKMVVVGKSETSLNIEAINVDLELPDDQ